MPIFKGGDQTNCQGILPTVAKVAEKWVAKQLSTYLNEGHTPLHSMQFGFRSNHSTETANFLSS